MKLPFKPIASALLAPLLVLLCVCSATAADCFISAHTGNRTPSVISAVDDIYCLGARYKVGQPFIDSSKMRAGVLTDLGYDPIVRIEGVEQRRGAVRRTIAYVYYNERELTALAPAVESDTTSAEKDEFTMMLSRIGIMPPPPELIPGTRFGNGFVRFFVGTQLEKTLDSTLELVKCQKT